MKGYIAWLVLLGIVIFVIFAGRHSSNVSKEELVASQEALLEREKTVLEKRKAHQEEQKKAMVQEAALQKQQREAWKKNLFAKRPQLQLLPQGGFRFNQASGLGEEENHQDRFKEMRDNLIELAEKRIALASLQKIQRAKTTWQNKNKAMENTVKNWRVKGKDGEERPEWIKKRDQFAKDTLKALLKEKEDFENQEEQWKESAFEMAIAEIDMYVANLKAQQRPR